MDCNAKAELAHAEYVHGCKIDEIKTELAERVLKLEKGLNQLRGMVFANKKPRTGLLPQTGEYK